jgi:type II secretory pathway pseudopilin PulG
MPQVKLKQSGQTLIETVVAIFILVMGITAALGLATFSLHSSTNIVKQLIGMGLAREGIEAVKNMRDTNWLNGTLQPTGCYDYVNSVQNGAPCYSAWLNPPGPGGYNINPGGSLSKSYVLLDDPNNNNPGLPNFYWNPQTPATKFGLKYNPSGTPQSYYYSPNGGTDPGDPDGFGTYYYRELVITSQSIAPYNLDSGGNLNRLMVESHVWWNDQRCPFSNSYAGAEPACRINLIMYLTNWKNYQ